MSETVVVHIPFGQHARGNRLILSKPQPLSDSPPAEWWSRRAEILRSITLPSVARQTAGKVVIVGTFAEQDLAASSPVRAALSEFGGHALVGSPRERLAGLLAERGIGGWVLLAHLDSDDAYAPAAVETMLAVRPARGRLVVLMNGYLFHKSSGEVYEYGSPDRAPPFFGLWTPAAALGSESAWSDDLKECGRPRDHVWLARMPGAVAVANAGMFLVYAHASNTVTGFAHRGTRRYLGPVLGESERSSVLKRFGLEGSA